MRVHDIRKKRKNKGKQGHKEGDAPQGITPPNLISLIYPYLQKIMRN